MAKRRTSRSDEEKGDSRDRRSGRSSGGSQNRSKGFSSKQSSDSRKPRGERSSFDSSKRRGKPSTKGEGSQFKSEGNFSHRGGKPQEKDSGFPRGKKRFDPNKFSDEKQPGSRPRKPNRSGNKFERGSDNRSSRFSSDARSTKGEGGSKEKRSGYSSPKKRFDSSKFSDEKRSSSRSRDEKRPGNNSDRRASRFSSDARPNKSESRSKEKDSGYSSTKKRFDSSKFTDEKRSSSRSRDEKRSGNSDRRPPRFSSDARPNKREFRSKEKDSGYSPIKKSSDSNKYSDKKENRGGRAGNAGRSEASEKYSVDAPQQTEKIRLNRFIANSGVCSRREADELITMGLISVNGKTITELGYKVNPGDQVRYEERLLKAERPVYILLNKPKGYLTTTSDPQERNTVMHLVANAVKERVYPVGRLDRNTTGLLLLTNDGELADKLMHPSYNVKKIYKVELDRPLTKADFQRLQEGIELEEGKAMVDDVAIVSEDGKTVGLELHIGWNRVVRRMFESMDYQVVKLDRSVYAGLDKKDLPRGHWRFLKKEEIIRLKHY